MMKDKKILTIYLEKIILKKLLKKLEIFVQVREDIIKYIDSVIIYEDNKLEVIIKYESD